MNISESNTKEYKAGLKVSKLELWNLPRVFAGILLRINVFVKEKKRPFYIEFDRRDFLSTHYVLEKASKIVGSARIRHANSISIIDRMVIKQKYRNKGYGTFVLKELLKIIEKRKKTKIIELTAYIEICNLYKKFGFQCVGNRILILGRACIKMQLKLNRGR